MSDVPLSHRIMAEGVARRKVLDLLQTGGDDADIGLWQKRWEHALRHLWRDKYDFDAPAVLRPWETPVSPMLTRDQVVSRAWRANRG